MISSTPTAPTPTPWELLVGRRAAGPPWATTGVASEEAFPAFVCAVLEEHAAKIEGCELHARATTFSSLVAADKWRATGGSLDEATRTAIFDACRRARVPHGSWPLGPERLVAVRHVGGKVVPGGRASLGVVLGVYPAVVDDVVIARHLDSIAHDLLVGARLARRLGDSAALSTLASTLARAGTRAQALEQIGLVLRERTRSCHAKVYVARWHDGQRQIQRMLRTDRPSAAPRTYPLRSDLGFADWVFRRRQWLLISEITNGDAEPDRGLSEDGEVCVLGRPSRMIDPSDAINDDERSLLLVPMWSDGQVLGVLSVWRETPDLYDPDLDQQSMEYFAHAVLSACRWRVEADANQHATDSVRELERVLRRGPAPGELYRAFTERAVTLASAAGGALFLRDDERREVAYPLAVVSGDLATLDGAMLAVAASVGAGDLPAGPGGTPRRTRPQVKRGAPGHRGARRPRRRGGVGALRPVRRRRSPHARRGHVARHRPGLRGTGRRGDLRPRRERADSPRDRGHRQRVDRRQRWGSTDRPGGADSGRGAPDREARARPDQPATRC